MSRGNKVKHALFLECAQLEKLAFWKKVFNDCARGKFPPGVLYRGSELLYRKKKRGDPKVFYIPNEPVEALRLLKSVFKEHVGLLSMDELTARQIDCRRTINENLRLPHDVQWSELRSPIVRLRLIADYVARVAEETNMHPTLKEQMYDTIVFGLALGTVSPNEIFMENYMITKIDGIELKPNGWHTIKVVEVELPPYAPKRRRKQQTDLKSKWSSYIDSYDSGITCRSF